MDTANMLTINSFSNGYYNVMPDSKAEHIAENTWVRRFSRIASVDLNSACFVIGRYFVKIDPEFF
jgi:hypothetical protein